MRYTDEEPKPLRAFLVLVIPSKTAAGTTITLAMARGIASVRYRTNILAKRASAL
jgi:hypothetical protein